MSWGNDCNEDGCTYDIVDTNLSLCRASGLSCEIVEQNGRADAINTAIQRPSRFVDQGAQIQLRAVENIVQSCDLETCEYRYPPPVNVTLTGVSRGACAIFTGLSGDCSGTAACTIRMDRWRIVTGNFRPSNSCGGVPDAR
jgi:hypothetical protein